MALRQPTDKHNGPIRVQTKNQVEEAVRLETPVYNPGKNYLRICTPSDAHYRTQQHYFNNN